MGEAGSVAFKEVVRSVALIANRSVAGPAAGERRYKQTA
jgi:hypothetical protein